MLTPPKTNVPEPCFDRIPVLPDLSAITPLYVKVPVPGAEIEVPDVAPTVIFLALAIVTIPLLTIANLPPSIVIVLAALPILPSVVNLTSATPFNPFPNKFIGPEKVFAAFVMSKRPVPFALAVNVMPFEPVFEITPPKTMFPPLPKVSVLREPPNDTVLLKVKFDVEFAKETTVLISPNWIFPPITIFEYLPVKSLFPLAATVPPFKVKSAGAAFPPIALVPRATNVPEVKVNPPPKVPPIKPKAPLPDFVNAAEADVENV